MEDPWEKCGHGPEERHCGHTDKEHEELFELATLVEHTTIAVKNPRVALVISDTGDIHFASSIAPHEAAAALEQVAARARRYGANYVRDHFDRGTASQWN